MRTVCMIIAAVAAAACLACSDRRSEPAPTVLLITLDTVRADHLGCYGYHRDTSPNIDEFARGSVVYDRAVAPATWTLPSHASLFTGKFTSSHGARYDPDGALRLTIAIQGPDSWDAYRVRTITPSERTLAEYLKAAGYTTGAVVGGPWLKTVFGLGKGFEHYDDDNITVLNGRPAEDVTDRALQWLDETSGPRFLFLNYFDPHFPYEPPGDFAHRFVAPDATRDAAWNVGMYDAEILYMDHHVGRLLRGLKAAGLYDDALIVVTADHGELLGEHGAYGHGVAPYQEVVRVPLLVKEPGSGGATGRRDEWVQLTDVFSLILERLQLAIPVDAQGEVPPRIGHPIVIESRTIPPFQRSGNWLALIDGDTKVVWNSKGEHMLFDLQVDPREERNLAASRAETVRATAARIMEYLASLPPPGAQVPPRTVDAETERALKSLGYIE